MYPKWPQMAVTLCYILGVSSFYLESFVLILRDSINYTRQILIFLCLCQRTQLYIIYDLGLFTIDEIRQILQQPDARMFIQNVLALYTLTECDCLNDMWVFFWFFWEPVQNH